MIVPVHDGGAEFRRCLAALASLRPQPGEILVVDDASRDASPRLAREAGFRVVRRDTRGGPAAARNQGAAVAGGEIFFFLDADVEPRPDVVARVVGHLAGAGAVDAVIGSYDDAPGADGFFSQYRNLLHRWVHQRSRSRATTFWGACGAVRREAFEAVGGFDPAYRTASVEDIELGGRLVAAGYRIRLDKELEVKHLKRWTALSMVRADLLRRAIPWTRLIHRQGRLPDDLNLAVRERWSALAAVAALAGALAAPFLGPAAAVAALLALAVVFALNLDLYRFFHRRRGPAFAVAAAVCHGVYLLYATFGFAVGSVMALVDRLRAAPPVGGTR